MWKMDVFISCLHVVEEVSLLPGAPVAIETLEMRLSGENRVEDSFGPELPPVMKGTEILYNVNLVYFSVSWFISWLWDNSVCYMYMYRYILWVKQKKLET